MLFKRAILLNDRIHFQRERERKRFSLNDLKKTNEMGRSITMNEIKKNAPISAIVLRAFEENKIVFNF